ncbi:hypothetical protein FRC04_003140 [Tulasnella sp. 424]|nr:hypothetical protein FRC04_003140 [Tulasnella sp. 424]KAG8961744.1 hypothetical protein FRC05_005811 [Tulasnella sp. 425]
MVPRATQVSQARRAGPSQSRRRRGADPDDDEEELGVMDYSDDEDDEGNLAGVSQARAGSQADGANKRRADGTGGLGLEVSCSRLNTSYILHCAKTSDAFLPENSRGINAVFGTAQKILRHTFGMEVVEFMTRSERDAIGVEKQAIDA